MTQKLQELKMKIAEYNPDIMELKFGCRIKFYANEDKRQIRGGIFIRDSKYENVLNKREDGSLYFDSLISEEDIIEVIGRDITLFDIIVFMSKIGYKVGELTKIIEMWKSPNCLDNQDDDTINIISKLCMQKVKNTEGIDTE